MMQKKNLFENSFYDTRILQKTFFEECKKAKPELKNISFFLKQGVQLTAQDQYEKTGLHYLCEQGLPQLDLILFFIEQQEGGLSIIISYTQKLIAQAIAEDSHHKIVLLLVKESIKNTDVAKVIKNFSHEDRTLIEQFIKFFVLHPMQQESMVRLLEQLLAKNLDADFIMEEVLKKHDLSVDLIKSNYFEKHEECSENVFQFDLELSPRWQRGSNTMEVGVHLQNTLFSGSVKSQTPHRVQDSSGVIIGSEDKQNRWW